MWCQTDGETSSKELIVLEEIDNNMEVNSINSIHLGRDIYGDWTASL